MAKEVPGFTDKEGVLNKMTNFLIGNNSSNNGKNFFDVLKQEKIYLQITVSSELVSQAQQLREQGSSMSSSSQGRPITPTEKEEEQMVVEEEKISSRVSPQSNDIGTGGNDTIQQQLPLRSANQ